MKTSNQRTASKANLSIVAMTTKKTCGNQTWRRQPSDFHLQVQNLLVHFLKFVEDGGFPHTRAATKNQDLRMAMNGYQLVLLLV